MVVVSNQESFQNSGASRIESVISADAIDDGERERLRIIAAGENGANQGAAKKRRDVFRLACRLAQHLPDSRKFWVLWSAWYLQVCEMVADVSKKFA